MRFIPSHKDDNHA